MSKNQFFEKKGPFPLNEITKIINCEKNISKNDNLKIYGLETLDIANENEMTFLNSNKYQNLSKKTNAVACITSKNLSKFIAKVIYYSLILINPFRLSLKSHYNISK